MRSFPHSLQPILPRRWLRSGVCHKPEITRHRSTNEKTWCQEFNPKPSHLRTEFEKRLNSYKTQGLNSGPEWISRKLRDIIPDALEFPQNSRWHSGTAWIIWWNSIYIQSASKMHTRGHNGSSVQKIHIHIHIQTQTSKPRTSMNWWSEILVSRHSKSVCNGLFRSKVHHWN